MLWIVVTARSKLKPLAAMRQHLPGGVAVMTPGVAALGQVAIDRIVKTIAVFDDFFHASDPYEEHDFGSFEVTLRRARTTPQRRREGDGVSELAIIKGLRKSKSANVPLNNKCCFRRRSHLSPTIEASTRRAELAILLATHEKFSGTEVSDFAQKHPHSLFVVEVDSTRRAAASLNKTT